ncbi:MULTISPECIES: bifunctional [glutamate--ammonia ligase]-adenylyl-L-tyrosine phosphorylase/[glutamate--ammonia-ligase] adenylyltransferase [Pseudidiomarina]|uniref:Bifunctional glutamine synthetase adenylyltransferase/adenylyl-removing enzyme n=2 Tax=Pseudidiomarina TaxID=2800384 RepID=A0A368UN98_9GAMM|nr:MULTISPECIES: bifunctional [glutamate--ammonia ligase]-adenylyl-L-tyrosine phosphorylase/[glutamate--ammonia-ligase] adenylyltransferase [Pseudidiomarina]PWW10590.1 glutamate-ammonia-ligase adenylyltransferase [Pseudidiomarina maritima]RBP88338.1 glutamate-ammonia-ligase adenylyltransferase [Pseudidiomarina tainanensis]RCW30268.1 glutamate-ammonia-ligase adenylyltransferase [Pseudidiomarina tainanensis]
MIDASAFVASISPFIARTLEQQPQAIEWRQQPGYPHQVVLPAPENYLTLVQQELQQCSDEGSAQRQLRQLRQRWYASLAAADLLQQISLADMLRHLSATADAFIIAAVQWLRPRLTERYGELLDSQGVPQQLYVIGMGKLGGGELNFSSDIDLIFCYPEQAETQHPRRPLEASVFFTKYAQALLALLDTPTADGRVFRIDLRLRPFGQSGPLVASMAALEYYYQEQGRDWERYAMVKARLIGASEVAQQQFSALLRPFVYRRYIDFSAIDALRKMKALITQETRRQGVRNNIKLGAGGIREIEFIAQVFQLIRGGQQRQLQTQSLYQAYAVIKQQQLLEPAVVDELLQSYEFLRKVEHVLQELNDEQTQTLPDQDDQQQAMAQVFKVSWPALVDRIDQAMQKVHQHFRAVIGATDEDDEEAGELQLLWQDMIEDDAAVAILIDAGLNAASAQQMWAHISQLRQEVRRRGSGPRGRQAMARLVPILIEQLLAYEDAEAVLERVLLVLRKIMSRTAYVELLVENKGAREQLLKLCRASSWLATQLAQYPLLLDELIDPQHLYQLPQLADYGRLVDEYLLRIPEQEADLEAQMDALRQARQVLQLRIAAADISGALPLMKVSDHLTYLAEAIIAKVVRLAWYQMAEKYGNPAGQDSDNMGFAVLAYGKLGGLELGYGSDLDLVFIADADYSGVTQGPREIENQQFYLRLAQRILHLLTTRTMVGVLYDTDMRLRPSGKAGLLVTRLDTYAKYLAEDAWTWELQALVRARPVFGREEIRQQLIQLRLQRLCQKRSEDELREQVVSMREKMREHTKLAVNEQEFDLKQGYGGITDIEFLVQYLTLRYAHDYPELATYTDNIRILETAGQLNLMPTEQAQQLIETYIRLRELSHQLALAEQSSKTHQDVSAARAVVETAWQQWLAAKQG